MGMKHFLPAELVKRQVRVLLVGAGGNGSQMLDYLVRLHRALIAKGHPGGLHVTVVDPDRVSPANIGRQAFYPSDVGSFKSITLVNRANMALGGLAEWSASTSRVTTESSGVWNHDIVIGAVDNRSARLGILRSLEGAMSGTRYYLDMGNRAADGQVVLGQVSSDRKTKDDLWRLPHVGELFPELIDSALDKVADDVPSCSLAEALVKQSLFVNPSMAVFAGNLLWQLFTAGALEAHGAFINLKDMRVTPLAIDHETWKRFGVIRDGARRRVVQPSRKKIARKAVSA
jgi:sulfur-carrier protein adenylyltransferase/sulfurtransferase